MGHGGKLVVGKGSMCRTGGEGVWPGEWCDGLLEYTVHVPPRTKALVSKWFQCVANRGVR